MRELTWENAAAYLQETGRVPPGHSIRVRGLRGGVSNVVLRVDLEDQPSFVIKQCRERLRVAMDWRARLDRIWAERVVLDVLGALLPPGTVPQVHFEDRPNYQVAMTCAPDDSETWKTHLMDGQADPRLAGRLGTILGTIHAEAPNHPQMRGTLADLERIGTGPWRPEGLVPRAIDHAAACVLARVDGKSPVEYLDPAGQELARRLAFVALETQPRTWDEMLRLWERQLHHQR